MDLRLYCMGMSGVHHGQLGKNRNVWDGAASIEG